MWSCNDVCIKQVGPSLTAKCIRLLGTVFVCSLRGSWLCARFSSRFSRQLGLVAGGWLKKSYVMKGALRFSSFKNITNPRKQALLSVNIVTRTTGHLFAGNFWHICSTTSEESKACNLKIITPSIVCSCVCGGQLLRHAKSEQLLVQFLSKEIAAEFKAQKVKQILCKSDGFYVKLGGSDGTFRKWNSRFFNCCFTVHFDKYKTILPTNAPFIKT